MRIDVKHSSFKKTLSLLKHLQSLGLLNLVSTDRLGSINRQHQLFRDYKDHIKVDDVDKFKSSVFISTSNEFSDKLVSTSASSSTFADNQNKLKIVDLFKFPRPLKEVFTTEIRNSIDETNLEEHLNIFTGEGTYNECLTSSEVNYFLSNYYIAHDKININITLGSMVIINIYLNSKSSRSKY